MGEKWGHRVKLAEQAISKKQKVKSKKRTNGKGKISSLRTWHKRTKLDSSLRRLSENRSNDSTIKSWKSSPKFNKGSDPTRLQQLDASRGHGHVRKESVGDSKLYKSRKTRQELSKEVSDRKSKRDFALHDDGKKGREIRKKRFREAIPSNK